jgi:hypothetical protein
VIFIPVAGGISNQNSISTLRSPVLFQGIIESTSDIFWTVATSPGPQLRDKVLCFIDILAKGEYFLDIFSVTVISVCDHGDSDLDSEILVADAFDDRLDLLFAGFNPR